LQRGQASIKPKVDYEEKNILFLEDKDWADKFFKRVLECVSKEVAL